MNTTKYLELIEERADLTAHGYEIQWGTYENLGQELRDSYEALGNGLTPRARSNQAGPGTHVSMRWRIG